MNYLTIFILIVVLFVIYNMQKTEGFATFVSSATEMKCNPGQLNDKQGNCYKEKEIDPSSSCPSENKFVTTKNENKCGTKVSDGPQKCKLLAKNDSAVVLTDKKKDVYCCGPDSRFIEGGRCWK